MRYVVTYSYPTVDRYYRGQRSTVIEAANRKDLESKLPQGSKIVRLRVKD